MFRGLQIFLTVLGRFFISLLFILSGINKVINWQDTKRAMITQLGDWHTYVTPNMGMQKFFASLLPLITIILLVAIAFQLIGGLLVFFGYKVRLGAVLLMLLAIPATFLIHHFWFLDGPRREMETILFMKNLAIIGGLFYVIAFGKVAKKPAPKIFPEIIKEDELPTIPKY